MYVYNIIISNVAPYLLSHGHWFHHSVVETAQTTRTNLLLSAYVGLWR